ncbi:terminase [Roseospira marina]|uniref:Terminase n=2 Tax=Roseospira marina TaxID=140057 RepID=A0A5M6IC31_9PROT|nr:terminase [Roseospira marina]
MANVERLLPYLTDAERAELDTLLTAGVPIWMPLPGPQTDAYHSEADVLGYGGAAGGGKSDLAIGLALTQHHRAAIFRRESTQLTGVVDRLTEILGARTGYNGSEKIWRLPDRRQIEFGSCPNLGDEERYQGRPKDLLVIDEATHFLLLQVRYLMGWVRTTRKGQRCRTVLTFNPPTSAEGQWVIEFFAPWLDDTHPNPAKPGELRWFATLDGKDEEVQSGEPFEHNGETIVPQSRTFIPSRIGDNPFLVKTGYMATLQAMPEPLRSQMLHGDFKAGMEDDPWQVIPTAWVIAAQDRWQARPVAKGDMTAMGVDPARGGRDEFVAACRHGAWIDELKTCPGTETPDGAYGSAFVVQHRRDDAPVHIDVIGWGSSTTDFLATNGVHVVPVNGAAGSTGLTRQGDLPFVNLRAEVWWRAREALDPAGADPIALPPDARLRADLCAPKWTLRNGGILVEAKEEIQARIGRSPDRGDAVVYSLIDTPKRAIANMLARRAARAGRDWRTL